ncbi:MAG: threonine transporter RhtB [Rhodobacterales bacterium]|nr:MAG: threonine transporter RhtB [Rhodobacterales bacterium]
MIAPATLAGFLPVALALNLTPGADMMFCLAQGLKGGPRHAWAASGGVAAGGLVHGLLAGVGLGALIASYPSALDAIRLLGASYLIVLAVQVLRKPLTTPSNAPARPPRRAFRDGLLVNLSNPKVILFFLALMPQFIRPEAGPVLVQFVTLAALLCLSGFIVNGLIGHGAGRISAAMLRRPKAERVLRALTATIFGTLAAKLVLSRSTA